MEFRLKDKVAVVTGGSRGIGRAVALTLARQGANIAICGRTAETLDATAEEIRAEGAQCWTYRADVSEDGTVEKLVADVVKDAGHLDILVNNAVSSTPARADELTDDLFRYHIDVKLMAYIRASRAALPHMQNGRIVNIGGMTARITAPLRMTNGVVNAGVANFTKQFASHAATSGTTVNCIHPGMTVTERVQQIFDKEAEEAGTDAQTIAARRTAEIPLGRLIQPQDMADAVLFFCSPLAAMITGQCIAVDGGSSMAVTY